MKVRGGQESKGVSGKGGGGFSVLAFWSGDERPPKSECPGGAGITKRSCVSAWLFRSCVTAVVVVLLTSFHQVPAAGSPTIDQMVGVTRSLLRVGVRCGPLKGS